MTKKALQNSPQGLDVIVDNMTARENITRFAKNSGYAVEISQNSSDYIIHIIKG